MVFDITQEGCMHAFLTQLAEREEAVNNSQEHHGCELSGKIVHKIGHAVVLFCSRVDQIV